MAKPAPLRSVEQMRRVLGPMRERIVRMEDRRAGDPAQLIASSDKARSVLGWNPQHADLEEIVASAWKWHHTHPNGYEE